MPKYKTSFTIKAPVESCWQAWTSHDNLSQWLGTVRKGSNNDDFCLSTSLPYLSGRHQLVSSETHQSLKFAWFIQGWPSELTIGFEPIKAGTKISIEHSVDVDNAPVSIEPLHRSDQQFYFLGQCWSLSIAKLRCLLEDRQPGVLISEQNNDHVINLQVDIKSPAAKIYDALLDAKQLVIWGEGLCLENTKVGTRVGDEYSYGWYPEGTDPQDMDDGPSEILALEENALVTVNWHGGQKIAAVSWKLKELDDGLTRVLFKHSPLLGHSTGNVWSYRCGWAESLYALKWFLERSEKANSWNNCPQ